MAENPNERFAKQTRDDLRLLTEQKVSHATRSVYTAHLALMGGAGFHWFGRPAVAELAGVRARDVGRYNDQLEAIGLLHIEDRPGRSNKVVLGPRIEAAEQQEFDTEGGPQDSAGGPQDSAPGPHGAARERSMGEMEGRETVCKSSSGGSAREARAASHHGQTRGKPWESDTLCQCGRARLSFRPGQDGLARELRQLDPACRLCWAEAQAQQQPPDPSPERRQAPPANDDDGEAEPIDWARQAEQAARLRGMLAAVGRGGRPSGSAPGDDPERPFQISRRYLTNIGGAC